MQWRQFRRGDADCHPLKTGLGGEGGGRRGRGGGRWRESIEWQRLKRFCGHQNGDWRELGAAANGFGAKIAE